MLPAVSFTYCINPDCPHPLSQLWEYKFCSSCGASLRLNDRYIPMQVLGSGGFATIYTVWDLETKTEKVLKVLLEASSKSIELFQQEAAVLSRLRHPGIPKVERDGYFQLNLTNPYQRHVHCLVMEKISGQTLEDILSQYSQGCPTNMVLNWLVQAIDILKELHRNSIIHRDIKPANLMVRTINNQLVTIDFGGAKQISAGAKLQASSTRLFSPGYSPPEQIVGGEIVPATDFYALGKTMIHLLTGRYPPDLEDPVTGELRWRHLIQNPPSAVSIALADLLDDLVQSDVRKRPANASQVQRRLVAISRINYHPRKQPLSVGEAIAKLLSVSQKAISWGFNGFSLAIALLLRGSQIFLLSLVQVITKVLQACLDTIWEMILGGIGASLGAATGFCLAYWLHIGTWFANFLTQQLHNLLPNVPITVGSEVILFALAGLGTTLGLKEAKGFGQNSSFFLPELMAMISYGLGGLMWQTIASISNGEALVGLVAIIVGLLTLGLNLPSHHLLHAMVTVIGTASLLTTLGALGVLPVNSLFDLVFISDPDWIEFGVSVALFTLLSVNIAFWLGLSIYIILPFVRFLF